MQALISADIPLHKLSNPAFQDFLEKYTGRRIPSPNTLRGSYLRDTFESTLQSIRIAIGEGLIYVSIDETTDVEGRFVCYSTL